MIGYAGIAQLTLGVQVGGQTFSEIIAFQDRSALQRFKSGRWAFAANASAVLVKAGAAASSNYERGAAVFVSSEGGMMLEAAIGAQRFFYRPAVLGRAKPTRDAVTKSSPRPKSAARKNTRKTSTAHARKTRPEKSRAKSGKTGTKRHRAKPRRPKARRQRSAAR
jgi:hypothetical protein